MVDIDRAFIFHIDGLQHLIDTVTEFIVVFELVVYFPDGLVAPVTEEGNIHFHLFGKHEVPGCHCIPHIQVDGTECTWCRAATCSFQWQKVDTQFFAGLDSRCFRTRVPVGGDATEIECILMFCFHGCSALPFLDNPVGIFLEFIIIKDFLDPWNKFLIFMRCRRVGSKAEFYPCGPVYVVIRDAVTA